MRTQRSRVFGVFVAAAALVGAGLALAPAQADVLFVSDVSASISAPSAANGAFSVQGTITNSGTLNQPAGSTLTFSATNGSVTSAPGCTLSAGAAVCSVGALSPGQAVTVAVAVTPAPGAVSVGSTVQATAAQLESNVLDSTNNTASTATGVAYGVDAALSNQPQNVLRGDDTLLSATVTNTKAPQTVNAVIATGGTVDTRIALPAGCTKSADNKNVNCSFALASGQSRSFDVAVATPTNVNSITSTLTATGASGGSKSVSVTTNVYDNAQAFVPEGDSLSYQGSNQKTVFSIPFGSTTGGGTFLQLTERDLTGVTCGGKPCISKGAEALFPSDGKYSGQNINKPYIWEISYDERQTCNGGGAGSGCLIDMYWIATNGTTTQPMPLCPTYNTTAAPRLANIDTPCLVKAPEKRTKGFATYTVAVLRDIVIPIVSSVGK